MAVCVSASGLGLWLGEAESFLSFAILGRPVLKWNSGRDFESWNNG